MHKVNPDCQTRHQSGRRKCLVPLAAAMQEDELRLQQWFIFFFSQRRKAQVKLPHSTSFPASDIMLHMMGITKYFHMLP